ncbi:MAG: DUF3626 domain-containing protein [Actinobacteria bacterium]|nr:DUF3626 domain-containing protein [Actinomycetota bacterium]
MHGIVHLDRDVEALVLDPCHRGTRIDTQARDLGISVEWHEGRVLTTAELDRHPHFRGPHIVELGRRLARDGILTAAAVDRAHATARHDPQDLKKLWHHIARFGSPAAEKRDPGET